jgi:hypothetical protein
MNTDTTRAMRLPQIAAGCIGIVIVNDIIKNHENVIISTFWREEEWNIEFRRTILAGRGVVQRDVCLSKISNFHTDAWGEESGRQTEEFQPISSSSRFNHRQTNYSYSIRLSVGSFQARIF